MAGIVDEVVQLNEAADYTHELARMLAEWRLIINDTEAGTQDVRHFEELSTEARLDILHMAWQVDSSTCRILEVLVPESLQKKTLLFECRLSFDIRTYEPYVYWSAPGLTYLETISLDFSRLPDFEKKRFFVQPFLGPVFAGMSEIQNGRYTLAANSWIMQGHGVVVMWQETSAPTNDNG